MWEGRRQQCDEGEMCLAASMECSLDDWIVGRLGDETIDVKGAGEYFSTLPLFRTDKEEEKKKKRKSAGENESESEIESRSEIPSTRRR